MIVEGWVAILHLWDSSNEQKMRWLPKPIWLDIVANVLPATRTFHTHVTAHQQLVHLDCLHCSFVCNHDIIFPRPILEASISYNCIPPAPYFFGGRTESLPAGFLGPSTARSTCPAIPFLLASNCEPMTPSLLSGPPIFSPIWPMAPSGLNCLPMAPSEEMTDGFYVES